MELTQNAIEILNRRYVRRDSNGTPIETPYELFDRVADAVASVEERYNGNVKAWRDEFYDIMTDMRFLPNSPTLMNAGTEDGQLSACFVLPIEDNMNSIFSTLRDAALIHKTGGGTGFSFSRLRPSSSIVKSTGGVASGPISFMKAYDAATETVKQGGKRRGANMGVLRVDHPDIKDFIQAKRNRDCLKNFNLSVAVTDAFMYAYENGLQYAIIDPYTGLECGSYDAKEVFNLIVDCAWESGEPGMLFIDVVNAANPTPALGEFESTNPCGEQPLLAGESCNLGSLNLSKYVTASGFDAVKMGDDIFTAVKFLDNVITLNNYPLDSIRDATLRTRKIGLGVMGWADALLMMGISYDSEQARSLASNVMEFITHKARHASTLLASERSSFPAINDSIWKGIERRHASVTTIAPTGTISTLANASPGIEPIFGYAYTKNVMDGDKLVVFNPVLFESKLLSEEQLMQLPDHNGSLKHIDGVPDHVKEIFVCAHDLSPEAHILMQAAFQENTDNAISKTVNFPNDCTKQDIANAFMLAYKSGCKGTTVYRDGSLVGQTVDFGKAAAPSSDPAPRDRSKTTFGFTDKVSTGCGNMYVTVNFDDEGICEVFTNTGKAGGCHAQSESSARLATVALRANVDHASIIKQLKGIRCPAAMRNPNSECLSCPDAIARTLSKAVGMGNTAIDKASPRPLPVATKSCPECAAPINLTEGCVLCPSCGYSKCN